LLEEDERIPPRTLTPVKDPMLLELDFWLLDDFDEHDDSLLEEELAVIVMETESEDFENEKVFI